MATATTEEAASKRPDRYGLFEATVFAATERLKAGQATADDMAFIKDVIDGYAIESNGTTMKATAATGEAAVRATVITHNPRWLEPVIPVFAGVTGWSIVEDDGFARWFHRPGEVVLGMWGHEYRVDEDTTFTTTAPAFEVALPLDEHTALLLDLVTAGGGTLAVLEFGGGEEEPPTWGHRWVSAEGLERVIQLALGRRRIGGETPQWY